MVGQCIYTELGHWNLCSAEGVDFLFIQGKWLRMRGVLPVSSLEQEHKPVLQEPSASSSAPVIVQSVCQQSSWDEAAGIARA